MEFIGLQMLVTLRQPEGTMLKGTVSEIEPGASLTLANVFTMGTNHWIPRIMIDAANILELSEYKEEIAPNTFTAPGISPVPAPVVTQPAQPVFADPAILSMGKRPGSGIISGSDSQVLPEVIPQPNVGIARDPQPGQPGVLPPVHLAMASRKDEVNIGLSESLQELDVDEPTPTAARHYAAGASVAQDAHEASGPSQPKKKNRRREKAKAPRNGTAEENAQESTPSRGNPANRGKGWRQTPILQSSPSFQPFNSLKRGIKGKKDLPENGWASEDVTEEMAEFDFEGSLAKFDKRTIFDQMRKEDQVDEADRLVSHNRKPKPGTAGGKNLHYTENVLDMPSSSSKANQDFWNSEADDAVNGGDRLSGREVRSAQGSRRAESKPGAARRSQSRKASAQLTSQPLNRMNSSVRLNRQPQALLRQNSSQSILSTNTLQHGTQPGFYLLPSNRRLETVSALQMLNLENIAANEIGLTEDMMTENAGRGIAEVTLTALEDPAIQVRLGTGGANAPTENPVAAATVVMLAGNNKSGIRAIAAARHLRNKGLNILVCVVGIERERDLLEDMRQQIRIFKNFGGRVHTKLELFEQLRKTSSNPAASVTLIIDALLGLAISFEELRTGDQATVYELIEWANRNEAFVLAVDVPTGIDPSTGKVSIIDGGRLYVKPRYVVAMGAPKKGLLEAMAPVESDPISTQVGGAVAEDNDWKLFIADMGLGAAVWKKAGTKIRRGIDFDNKWVLQMRYQPILTQE